MFYAIIVYFNDQPVIQLQTEDWTSVQQLVNRVGADLEYEDTSAEAVFYQLHARSNPHDPAAAQYYQMLEVLCACIRNHATPWFLPELRDVLETAHYLDASGLCKLKMHIQQAYGSPASAVEQPRKRRKIEA